MKRKWFHPGVGEWVRPIRRGYRMKCCDCGLVHVFNFRVVKGVLVYQVRRDNRSTAAGRRKHVKPG